MWFWLALALAQTVDYQAEGLKALDAKQYDAAVELLNKAVAADPKDYGAQFNLALAYSIQGKDADAIPHYKTALELKPGLYEAELNLGISLVRSKDPAGAIPYLKNASEQKPKEFRPVYNLGQAELEAGKFPDAEAAFVSAIALNASSAGAEAGLGNALARQGKLAEAEPHLRKAATLDPAYKSAMLALAEMYEQQHQTAQAIAIYREFPQNPGAQERMGALLEENGDAAAAIPALEEAVAKSPSDANRLALAQTYVKTKQLDKAAPLAAQVVSAQPNDYELRLFYARILRDQRHFTAAADQFLTASKLKSDAVQPWNELAGVLIVSEQWPQALSALDRSKALGGETVAHYYLRAIAYDHLHQLKEALEYYTKFLENSQGKNPDEEFKSRQRARIIRNELNKK